MVKNKRKKTLECPFCGEETVKTVEKWKPGSSVRGGGKDFKLKMVSTDCENCGKEKKEIKRKLKKKGFPIKN